MKKRPQGLADHAPRQAAKQWKLGRADQDEWRGHHGKQQVLDHVGGKQKGGKGVQGRSQGQIDRRKPGKKREELRSPKSRK